MADQRLPMMELRRALKEPGSFQARRNDQAQRKARGNARSGDRSLFRCGRSRNGARRWFTHFLGPFHFVFRNLVGATECPRAWGAFARPQTRSRKRHIQPASCQNTTRRSSHSAKRRFANRPPCHAPEPSLRGLFSFPPNDPRTTASPAHSLRGGPARDDRSIRVAPPNLRARTGAGHFPAHAGAQAWLPSHLAAPSPMDPIERLWSLPASPAHRRTFLLGTLDPLSCGKAVKTVHRVGNLVQLLMAHSRTPLCISILSWSDRPHYARAVLLRGHCRAQAHHKSLAL